MSELLLYLRKFSLGSWMTSGERAESITVSRYCGIWCLKRFSRGASALPGDKTYVRRHRPVIKQNFDTSVKRQWHCRRGFYNLNTTISSLKACANWFIMCNKSKCLTKVSNPTNYRGLKFVR